MIQSRKERLVAKLEKALPYKDKPTDKEGHQQTKLSEIVATLGTTTRASPSTGVAAYPLSLVRC